MVKALVKLAIIVLLANGIWRVSAAYISYYKFKDAVKEAAMYSKDKTDDQLRQKVMDLAAVH